ncbi:hypothetical protein BY996DRAFT_6426580 [Phakopsora pachyrhizi]|nr:hypothetical protein BY996DRAFT_6426580 [Phakopsora pachyrhizi]
MQFLIAASLYSSSLSRGFLPLIKKLPSQPSQESRIRYPHTFCYNFFYKKTRVSLVSPIKEDRCDPDKKDPKKSEKCNKVEHPNKRHAKQRVLTKRYDDEGWKWVTNLELAYLVVTMIAEQLSSSKNYIMRQSDANLPEEKRNVQYAPVVDVLNLGGNSAKKNGDGCFRIGVTNHTFFALNPTAGEIQNGTISQLLWDFDAESSDDKAKENGPF